MRHAVPIALLALAACLAEPRARADEPSPKPDAAKPADDSKPVDPKKAAEAAKAAAEEAKANAARRAALVKKGTELCATNDVEDGLAALDAAWAQAQDADLAITLAACEIKIQRWAGAAEHLAYALRVKRDPEERKGITPTFVDVRARVAGVKVTVNIDGADVFVADRYAGQSPLAAEVYVPPGKARVTAKKPGFAEVGQLVAAPPNGTVEVSLDLVSDTALEHRRTPVAPRSRRPAYVLGGLTLVTAGIGGALVAAGASKGSAADSLLGELQTGTNSTAPCPMTTGCNTLTSLRSGHDSLVNAGIGVFAVSGALLVTTIIYGLWATRAPDVGGLSFTPVASASGGGILGRGTF